ncbi:hypothetical protein [Alishewanella longhuensis]
MQELRLNAQQLRQQQFQPVPVTAVLKQTLASWRASLADITLEQQHEDDGSDAE